MFKASGQVQFDKLLGKWSSFGCKWRRLVDMLAILNLEIINNHKYLIVLTLSIVEKATSNLLLEPDWGSIMMICDLIRQKDCP